MKIKRGMNFKIKHARNDAILENKDELKAETQDSARINSSIG